MIPAPWVAQKENTPCKVKGLSIIEVLISIVILGFVLLSIVTGITQQQLITRTTFSKTTALTIAENHLEDLLKFPGSSLAPGITIDYVLPKQNRFEVLTQEPVLKHGAIYRRTTKIENSGDLTTISVEVEYGAGRGLQYPLSVILKSQRGG
jgi:hypothetical protein